MFSVPRISCFATNGDDLAGDMDVKAIRRDNLRRLIKRHNSAAHLSSVVGTSAAYLSQILSEKTKANVGDTLARQIEVACGLPLGWMDHEQVEGVGPVTYRRVIVTAAISTTNKKMESNTDNIALGAVDVPSSDPMAYAAKISGDDLHPRIRDGEILVIEPSRPPEPGDTVLIRTADEALVCELMFSRGGKLHVMDVNGRERSIIDVAKVTHLHTVVMIVASQKFVPAGR